nr:exodeoxyribonuclease VII large subunit [Vallitaleaceae bacterium]
MDRKILHVSQVNLYIKQVFDHDYVLQNLSVQGEISNYKLHSSGHAYFTLKDADAAISCVFFKGYRINNAIELANGLKVIVKGSVSVYERDGKYQIYVKEVSDDGLGLLYQKYELLKRECEARGYFDQSIKQTIPSYAQKVGIVTSQTGAAIQDIINVAKRRNPYITLQLYPAMVQGEKAYKTIVDGINYFTQDDNVDVIIIGRGGGSIEDLWAFNEKAVVEAIFNSHIPIISAVGHETDFTLSDFAADLRAPTPSAAAELAVYD